MIVAIVKGVAGGVLTCVFGAFLHEVYVELKEESIL